MVTRNVRYNPAIVPDLPESLPRYLNNEFRKLEAAFEKEPEAYGKMFKFGDSGTLTTTPSRIEDWDADVGVDINTITDNALGRITVLENGVFNVVFTGNYDIDSGQEYTAVLYIDGAPTNDIFRVDTSNQTNATNLIIVTNVQLQRGQYVEIWASVDSGTRQFDCTNANFSIRK